MSFWKAYVRRIAVSYSRSTPHIISGLLDASRPLIARAKMDSNMILVADPPFIRVEPVNASGPTIGSSMWHRSPWLMAATTSAKVRSHPSIGTVRANSGGLKPKSTVQNRSGCFRQNSSWDATNGADNPHVIPTNNTGETSAVAASSVERPSCQLSSGASLEVNNAASPPAMRYLKQGRRPELARIRIHACPDPVTAHGEHPQFYREAKPRIRTVATTKATRPEVPHPDTTTAPFSDAITSAASSATATISLMITSSDNPGYPPHPEKSWASVWLSSLTTCSGGSDPSWSVSGFGSSVIAAVDIAPVTEVV
eukprot:m.114603 g.114603  ORF g.114603 m.114603 type:complete len:311 (+) comp13059_c0_seq1:833-1765(+)